MSALARLRAVKGTRGRMPTLGATFRFPSAQRARMPMSVSVPHRHLWSPDRLSSAELQALLDTAAALERAKRRGDGWGPLRGRHLALLCNGADDAATAFQRAVHELGGSVALLDAHDWQTQAGARVADAARLLGRLYDAVDCCDLPPALLEQIEAHCGVPVFNGVAKADHPLSAMVAALLADNRQCALQALMVCSLQ
jgi:ornithine carbamoyltransferase